MHTLISGREMERFTLVRYMDALSTFGIKITPRKLPQMNYKEIIV